MKNDLQEIRNILLETKEVKQVMSNYEYIIYSLKTKALDGKNPISTYAIDNKCAQKVYELLLEQGFNVKITGELKTPYCDKVLIKVSVDIKKMK